MKAARLSCWKICLPICSLESIAREITSDRSLLCDYDDRLAAKSSRSPARFATGRQQGSSLRGALSWVRIIRAKRWSTDPDA